MIQIKKSTALAAYLAVTAYVMGGIATHHRDDCPNDSNAYQIGLVISAAIIWPGAVVLAGIGYDPGHSSCQDGSPRLTERR